MSFIVTKFLTVMLLPPLSLLLLAGLGLALLPVRRRAGVALFSASMGALFVLSMPVVATFLAGLIEAAPVRALDAPQGQVIVILGAGTYSDAPEYGRDTVSASTLERVRWGARVHHATGLPIVVTGGAPFATQTSEAAQMQATLTEDFDAPAKWVEEKSLTTFESARNVRAQLAPEKITGIVLVTHALHMRRAHLVFERAGFQVIDSPTGFSTIRPPGILNYLPSARALELTSSCLHELLGTGWYHLRLSTGALAKDQK
jgi:uncharacterized SAM-binding protein YcdF (DUF218 family)